MRATTLAADVQESFHFVVEAGGDGGFAFERGKPNGPADVDFDLSGAEPAAALLELAEAAQGDGEDVGGGLADQQADAGPEWSKRALG